MESFIYPNQVIQHFYIHFPFCIKKCTYCSFYSEIYNKENADRFISKIVEEILYYNKNYSFSPVSIYFGGGTPSLLTQNQISLIINTILSVSSEYDEGQIEITMEINPGTVEKQNLKEYSDAGVNRYSIGVQSMLANDLNLLGRIHCVNDINRLYSYLSANECNFSYDIMFGLPKQTLKEVDLTLNSLLEIPPKHFSIYCLSLESDVPLFKEINNLPDDEKLEEMYFHIIDKLTKAGFYQYEISNFALPGKESIHNLAYWSGNSYLAFGPAASGFIQNYRYTNISDLETYLDSDFNNISEKIFLENDDFEKEYIITGLRKTQGICIDEFNTRFKTEFHQKYQRQVSKLTNQNLIIVDDNNIKINPKSYFISNEVLCEFI